MWGRPSSARAVALIAGGALGVHELRYLLAPAAGGGHAGHAYLPLAHVLTALALAFVVVQLGLLVRRARRARDSMRCPSSLPARDSMRCPFSLPGRYKGHLAAGSGPRSARSGLAARSELAARSGLAASWALAAAAILAVFVAQELIEGALAAGRSPGLTAVFADGGWVAPLLAVAAGGLAAAGLRGANAVIAAAARRAAVPETSIRPRRAGRALPAPPRRRTPALAEHLAGRAPPQTA